MQNCSCTASAWHTAHRIPGGNELHLNANWRHLAMPDLCKGQKPAHELETCHYTDYTEIRWNKPRETEKGSKRDLAQLPTCREQFAKKMWISLCVAWCIPMIFWMCYRECLIHVWLSSSCAVSCLLLKNGEAGSSSGPKRELHRTDTHTGTIFGTEFRFAPGQLWTQTSHMIQKKDQRRYSDRVLEPSSFIFFSWVKGRYEPRFPHGHPACEAVVNIDLGNPKSGCGWTMMNRTT